jgi:hypothetical protein
VPIYLLEHLEREHRHTQNRFCLDLQLGSFFLFFNVGNGPVTVDLLLLPKTQQLRLVKGLQASFCFRLARGQKRVGDGSQHVVLEGHNVKPVFFSVVDDDFPLADHVEPIVFAADFFLPDFCSIPMEIFQALFISAPDFFARVVD